MSESTTSDRRRTLTVRRLSDGARLRMHREMVAALGRLSPEERATSHAVMDEYRAGLLWKRGIPRKITHREACNRWLASESARARLAHGIRVLVDRLVLAGRGADLGRRRLRLALRPRPAQHLSKRPRQEPPSIRHRDVLMLVAAPNGPNVAGAMPAAA